MPKCENCQTELCVVEVLSGIKARCAVCGHSAIVAGTKSEFVQMRGAWWSLGLGLGSILFLFLSGIPAMYLGIRALLKMRYQKVTKATKWAAITGTASGGLLGIVFGGCVSFVGIFALIAMLTSEEATTPEHAQAMYESSIHFDIPRDSNIKPYAARKSIVPSSVDLRDDQDFNASRTRLCVASMPSWTTTQPGSSTQNRNALRQNATRSSLGARPSSCTANEESQLEWLIVGEKCRVAKTDWTVVLGSGDQQTTKEFVEYQTLFDCNAQTYAVSLACLKPEPRLTEAQIKKIFESFQSVVQ